MWSWDITKLRGPARGGWFQLYVMLDIFPRYVVAWTVNSTETSGLAKTMLVEVMGIHGIPEAVHAGRGTSRPPNPWPSCCSISGSTAAIPGRWVRNDNPFSEAAFKTLKYAPVFPEASDPWPTRGRSARRSSTTTTMSTAIPGSGCTRPRRSTTAPPARSGSRVKPPSTRRNLPTRSGSVTADLKHPNSPGRPGSTSPHRGPSYRPRNETCLRLLDIFRSRESTNGHGLVDVVWSRPAPAHARRPRVSGPRGSRSRLSESNRRPSHYE
ncbi:MAG: DDE-type integrase/transposase/recombinase [Solirubrobacterales bacterium]